MGLKLLRHRLKRKEALDYLIRSLEAYIEGDEIVTF